MAYIQQDLFLGEEPEEEGSISPHESVYQKFKRVNNYRRRISNWNDDTQNCGTCRHGFQIEGNTRNYRKCDLMGSSASSASDVSSWCVCDKWGPKQ